MSPKGMPQYAAKRDANEPEIIQILEYTGAKVQKLSLRGVPDLLVGTDLDSECPHCRGIITQRTNLLIEVKNGKSAKLTEDEVLWHTSWLDCGGQVAVCRTIDEALRLVGR